MINFLFKKTGTYLLLEKFKTQIISIIVSKF